MENKLILWPYYLRNALEFDLRDKCKLKIPVEDMEDFKENHQFVIWMKFKDKKWMMYVWKNVRK